MTDRGNSSLARTSSHVSDSQSSNSVRPRTKRLVTTNLSNHSDESDGDASRANTPGGLLSAFSPAPSRGASPLPPRARAHQSSSRARSASPGNLGQFFNDTWNQGWSSVQDLTSSFFATNDAPNQGGSRGIGTGSGSRRSSRPPTSTPLKNNRNSKAPGTWGPLPPDQTPGLDDVAAGSLAERQAALKAARTASVLESHEGVNGGLDVSGRYKRRNSDDNNKDSRRHEDYLVYVHKVKPEDTYQGLILRYKCREDAFRRANGLWSRDSVQIRKWLTIPVDACDLRGRPCEPPSWANSQQVDHLAPTPALGDDDLTNKEAQDDYFSQPRKPTDGSGGERQVEEEDKPWIHVRWVKIDSMQEPIEIGRVAWGSMGYFPPRRKRSIRTISSFSTPRHSLDISSTGPGSTDGVSPRRLSSISNRPQLLGTPMSNRSRLGSDSAERKPAWMRQPGGVGTMGKNSRAPGPDKDYINTWTKKHIPGLNIEGPSMAINASETAHFGFGNGSGGIVETSIEEGRDASAANRQGTGLDRAAAAVETWLRGALAKPGTPLLKARSRLSSDQLGGDGTGDLIELTDATSDDGRAPPDATVNLNNPSLGSSSRSNGGGGALRGRSTGAEARRDKKSD